MTIGSSMRPTTRIDAPNASHGRVFPAPLRSIRLVRPLMGRRPAVSCALAALAAACAGIGLPEPSIMPLLEARSRADDMRGRNRLHDPGQLVFTWRAREPDFRIFGSGVARVEPPDKARLDLFTDNGETVLVAVVIGDEVLTPAAAVPVMPFPHPALLWAALGVFRPGQHSILIEGHVSRGAGTLLYRDRRSTTGQLRFGWRDQSVTEVSVLDGGSVVESLTIDHGSDDMPYPNRAEYRNLRDFREMTIELEQYHVVDSFPADIWTPAPPP